MTSNKQAKPFLNLKLTSTENGFTVTESRDYNSEETIYCFETAESLTAHIREVAHKHEQDRILANQPKETVSEQTVRDYFVHKHSSQPVIDVVEDRTSWRVIYKAPQGHEETMELSKAKIAAWEAAQ